jgi:aspartate-semialdehyde dehydrogenase
MREWTGKAPELPSSPRPLLVVTDRRDRPSTRFDVDRGSGMTCTVGRVERCSVMGLKFFALAHNTVRGAAGAAIANGELLAVTGRLG